MADTVAGDDLKTGRNRAANHGGEASRKPTKAEVIATKAVKRFDPLVVRLDAYDEIPRYGGGTLVLFEAYYPAKEGKTDLEGPHEYMVVVRDGWGFVYNDWATVSREGARNVAMISRLASPDVVTASLTFILVLSYVSFATGAFESAPDHAVQALGAALTTVLGFWFGRQSK